MLWGIVLCCCALLDGGLACVIFVLNFCHGLVVDSCRCLFVDSGDGYFCHQSPHNGTSGLLLRNKILLFHRLAGLMAIGVSLTSATTPRKIVLDAPGHPGSIAKLSSVSSQQWWNPSGLARYSVLPKHGISRWYHHGPNGHFRQPHLFLGEAVCFDGEANVRVCLAMDMIMQYVCQHLTGSVQWTQRWYDCQVVSGGKQAALDETNLPHWTGEWILLALIYWNFSEIYIWRCWAYCPETWLESLRLHLDRRTRWISGRWIWRLWPLQDNVLERLRRLLCSKLRMRCWADGRKR